MWTIDFTNVTEGGIPEGEYVAKVKLITREESNYPYLKWQLVILSGAAKGMEINHITTLKPEGLFNLRNTMQACGFNVPKSAVKIDPKSLIGRTLGIVVKKTPSKNDPTKTFSNVASVKPASEVKSVGGRVEPTPMADTHTTVVDEMDDTMVISEGDL